MPSSNSSHLRSSPNFWQTFLLVTTGSVTLIISLIIFTVWQTGNRIFNGIEGFFTAPQPQPNVQIPTLIVQQIRGVSELTTAAFAMEAVVPTSQERKLGNLTLGETKLLYIAYGEVKAGIDLSQLSENHILIDHNKVKVTLPSPQILDTKIDVNRSHVYDYDRGFLNLGPDTAPQLQTLAQQKTLSKILTTACQQGILQEANQRAETAVTQLLSTAGYQSIEVETTASTRDQCVLKKDRS
ncbi:MAG: DUF4230 domain-containing protein [Microcystaceae cyanobacterium]